jgi:hypothetical protein
VINLEQERWYIVEAELGSHGTQEQIAPQVSRQMLQAIVQKPPIVVTD